MTRRYGLLVSYYKPPFNHIKPLNFSNHYGNAWYQSRHQGTKAFHHFEKQLIMWKFENDYNSNSYNWSTQHFHCLTDTSGNWSNSSLCTIADRSSPRQWAVYHCRVHFFVSFLCKQKRKREKKWELKNSLITKQGRPHSAIINSLRFFSRGIK